MDKIDYYIIIFYFIGLIFLGWILSKRIKSSEDLFLAGKNSSWWLSGLSTYMTIFSAGTFVVWGGVAYKSGLVAVTIGMMLGIASLFVGKYIVEKWSLMGIHSPGEYIEKRFNRSIFNFYLFTSLVGRAIHMAVSLYAIAIVTAALVPLPEEHFLANPQTGNLSLNFIILFVGLVTVLYTSLGGFLSVLMTDLTQFAVLIAMVFILAPLSLSEIGGIQPFIANAPPDFFSLFNEPYTVGWMILWLFLNFFVIAGDWAFVQRYISVPSVKEAKKSIYLVGILYLITPIIWYLPSMVYRQINPNVNPEQSYILISQLLLGPGMIGLMLAALLSATLSTISSTLNVFANVFTYDIYKNIKPYKSEKGLIFAGRIFTWLFGFVIIVLAILVPHAGGAEKVVVSALTLIISPLFIPSIWGLFSKRIRPVAIWISMGVTYFLGLSLKLDRIKEVAQINPVFLDAFIGFVFPVSILSLLELYFFVKEKRNNLYGGDSNGWKWLNRQLKNKQMDYNDDSRNQSKQYSRFALNVLLSTFGAIGLIMILINFFSYRRKFQLIFFGCFFLIIAGGFYTLRRHLNRQY